MRKDAKKTHAGPLSNMSLVFQDGPTATRRVDDTVSPAGNYSLKRSVKFNGVLVPHSGVLVKRGKKIFYAKS